MLHLFKYRFIQTTRDFSVMFWALTFPLILGTLFYLSFGSLGIESTGDSDWDTVKVAVIQDGSSSENHKAFEKFLEQMDGEILDIQDISDEPEALDALIDEKILGIFYVKETPSLTVSKNGIHESILTSVLETYNRNAAMFRKIAMTHPDRLLTPPLPWKTIGRPRRKYL